MKYNFILFLALLTICEALRADSTNNYVPNLSETLCPESRQSDIMILTSIIGNPQLQSEFQLVGLEIAPLDIEVSELQEESNIPEFLRLFWQERDVEIVKDPDVCLNTSKALDYDGSFLSFTEEYRPVYYQMDNKYLIMYMANRGLSHRSRPSPQVMDGSFNILGEISLRNWHNSFRTQ